ncbi:hypothetical protein KIPB_002034 [Kipferlia bialata]|uniref:Kelch repeat type 1 n=1 Tax=Kipferlia bialata TaxID=797122 RepID=A0A9K3CRL9_9EUKA|nr:hypothetical protein KIPB_002034 [Kipferlia bialata]|eukprot:g2034.t1
MSSAPVATVPGDGTDDTPLTEAGCAQGQPIPRWLIMGLYAILAVMTLVFQFTGGWVYVYDASGVEYSLLNVGHIVERQSTCVYTGPLGKDRVSPADTLRPGDKRSHLLLGQNTHDEVRTHCVPVTQDPQTKEYTSEPLDCPIPQDIRGITGTRIGDRVYYFGGMTHTHHGSDEHRDTFHSYDINTREWHQIEQPTDEDMEREGQRERHEQADRDAIGGVYFFPESEDMIDRERECETGGEVWAPTVQWPMGRSALTSFTLGGCFYLVGGYNNSLADATLSDCWKWDPRTRLWERMPDCPVGFHSASSCTVGDTVHIIGGLPSLDMHLCYSVRLGWVEMPPLPFTVSAPTVAASRTDIHVMADSQSCHTYDTLTGTWRVSDK